MQSQILPFKGGARGKKVAELFSTLEKNSIRKTFQDFLMFFSFLLTTYLLKI